MTTCRTCGRPYTTREQWRFTGREKHWGYTYLVWTRNDGRRWAQVIL